MLTETQWKEWSQLGFEETLAECAISQTYHPELDLTILNYSQLDSPKTHPTVRMCRSLVCDLDYNIVAQGFRRFFNLGEVEDEFNWSNFSIQEKVDGSYIKLFWYRDRWLVTTRKTFGQGNISECGPSWETVVKRNLNLDGLVKTVTYIFELVGPLNQVVREYPEGLYLIAARENGYELSDRVLDALSCQIGVLRPSVYQIDRTDLKDWMAKTEQADPTFEGVVLRDDKFNRYKFKSKTWYELSRLRNNGHVASKGGFLEFYLRGEEAELMVLLPQYLEVFQAYQSKLSELIDLANSDFSRYNHLSQKDFALSIQHRPWKSILFEMRKGKTVRAAMEGKTKFLLEFLESV